MYPTWIRFGLAAMLACGGAAMFVPMAGAQIMAGPGFQKAPPVAKKPVPPPSLPGAQPDSDRVTPNDKTTMDMPPTDALFDGINRGDIASARDAISRGAELDGHNLLGMTPLELSVDLGRNNITFLLLSLRGAEPGPRKASAVAANGAAPPAKKVARAERRPVVPAREASAKATSRTPALFAGDGGTPIPAAGFLGFDAGRSGTVR